MSREGHGLLPCCSAKGRPYDRTCSLSKDCPQGRKAKPHLVIVGLGEPHQLAPLSRHIDAKRLEERNAGSKHLRAYGLP